MMANAPSSHPKTSEIGLSSRGSGISRRLKGLTQILCNLGIKCLRKMGFHLNGLVHFSLIWIMMYHFPFIVVADISKFVSLTTRKPSILSVRKKIARSSINGGRNRYGNL